MTTIKRATGIGGVFFKVKDPEATRAWYSKHLGLNTDQYGTNFEWRHADTPTKKGFSLWSPFKNTTDYFDEPYMINFRVENLEELVEQLKREGVTVVDDIDVQDYGKFVHILDDNGIKVELWEAVDDNYDAMIGDARTS